MNITSLALRDLMVSEDNVRTSYDDESITELAESIRSQGLISPLVVMPRGVGYQILAGHRRFKALLKVHDRDTKIPCVVKDQLDSTGYTQLMLVENLQRSDLDPIDEARGYQRLVDGGMTRDAIAKSIGKSGAYITKRLALLELPEELTEAVSSKTMALETAYKLSGLSHDTLQEIVTQAKKKPDSLSNISQWQIDSLKRDEANKIAQEKLQKFVAGFANVVDNLPDTPHQYVGRFDGNTIDQYMPGHDDIVVNRKSFIHVYTPGNDEEESDPWDAYHEACDAVRQAYRAEVANYQVARKMLVKSFINDPKWAHRDAMIEAGIRRTLRDDYNIIDEYVDFAGLNDEFDEEAFEDFIEASRENLMKVFMVYASSDCDEQWFHDLLKDNGIVAPVMGPLPEEPEDEDEDDEEINTCLCEIPFTGYCDSCKSKDFVEPENEDEDNDFNELDDDNTSYVDDTPDENLAYEGSQYDPYE
jgi:ParB family chromosome partitioning protein